MLNTDAFVVLGGDPSAWDEETRQRVPHGRYNGTYNSDHLVNVQEDQHRRGRRSAELVQTMYGWSVRYASGLDANAIIFGGRNSPPLTREQAIDLGVKWANEDPKNREFYTRKSNL